MTLPHPDPDQVKRDLARRYVVERGWKLLLLAPDTKTPINSWRSGKKEGFDPAALPKSRGARRDYLRTFAASTDPALVRAWLDEWPDAGLAVDCAQSSLIAIDLDQKPDEGKDGNEALSRIFLQHFPGGRRDEPPSVAHAKWRSAPALQRDRPALRRAAACALPGHQPRARRARRKGARHQVERLRRHPEW
jgi:hypothetical protein